MSEVTQLEHQKQDAKERIARRDSALRLAQNPDFKQLILREFCVEECARYAQTSADPALSEVDQKNALAIAQAAGHLRRFLSVVIQMGNQASDQMVALEEAIEEARAEEVAD